MGRDRPGSYGRRVQPTPPSSPSLPGVPPVPPGPPPAPPSTPRRRRWLRRALLGGGAVVVVVVLVVGAVVTWAYRGAKESNVGDLDFANELRIPPLAEPTIAADGTKEFDLRFTAGTTDLVAAGPERDLGAQRHLPRADGAGRARRPGARCDVTNGVDEPTTLHWHGMHLPAAHGRRPPPDGRAGRDVVARVDDRPARRVALVPPPPARADGRARLPGRGGHVPDRRSRRGPPTCPTPTASTTCRSSCRTSASTATATLDDDEPLVETVGFLGDTIARQRHRGPAPRGDDRAGAPPGAQRLERPGLRPRLPRRPLVRAGGDRRGPAGAPARDATGCSSRPASGPRSWSMSPPASAPVLRSFAPDLGVPVVERFAAATTRSTCSSCGPPTRSPRPPPSRPAGHDRPARPRRRRAHPRVPPRRIEDQRRPTWTWTASTRCPAGTTEIWEIRNTDGNPHSFHPHLVHFSVLDVDGEPPPPELSGWKDTIYVPPDTTVRIIARFDGEPDPDDAVHVPLPRPAPRGRRDDGPVRARRPGPAGRPVRHGHPGHRH